MSGIKTTPLSLRKNFFYLIAATVVVLAGMMTFAPEIIYAKGLCHDGLAGVTTKCPSSTRYKIDGKDGGNFDQSKCYRVDDPEKGWYSTHSTGTAVNCEDQVFKDVVDVQTVPKIVDNAQKGECPTELDPSKKCDLVELYLNPIINGLAILVGIVVVISMVIGGIQYITSADQPQAATAARHRIMNAVFALICFIFLYAFLQWVVPGGLI